MITPDLLTSIGAEVQHANKHAESLDMYCGLYEINTPLRVSHFLAQVFHESGRLRWVEENLNYSIEGLMRIFPRYFPADLASLYARRPQAIASRVYANRMGNGDERSAEGWSYRGRGLIQLTGKDNYKAFGLWMGKDVVCNPDLVATKYAAASAVWFWTRNNLNLIADRDSIRDITRRVNGGLNGLEDRQKYLNRAKRELGILGT